MNFRREKREREKLISCVALVTLYPDGLQPPTVASPLVAGESATALFKKSVDRFKMIFSEMEHRLKRGSKLKRFLDPMGEAISIMRCRY